MKPSTSKFIKSRIPSVTLFSFVVFIMIFNSCQNPSKNDGGVDSVAVAQQLIGLEFTQSERDSLRDGLKEDLGAYEQLRSRSIGNEIPPSIWFNPAPTGRSFNQKQLPIQWDLPKQVQLPENKNELAFYTVAQLAHLIKTRQITSFELTQLYLERLKKFNDTLQCVVTLIEEEALDKAKRVDKEIAQGKYKGPLHGIPYGVKDLLAVKGYKTTWGAMPYKDQTIDETATIVRKLDAAGAILIAKLSLGALAWGDVWYGGKTKNPWNLEQGSSGSSAGSASATSAGLVAFSIGTETLGSIVSPSTRCSVTGLRPTYGRVSRHGAMALSWTMDKIGPICRSAEDCALVFEVIRGQDDLDQSTVDKAFNYDPDINFKTLRVGYLKSLFERDYFNKKNDSICLEVIKDLGATLVPVELPNDIPVGALSIILTAEAGAAFDELTRNNRDSLLVRQIKNAWPNVFRQSRFIPAVEYIQANRHRHTLIQEVDKIMKDLDILVSPSFGGSQLLITNLTGHPCVVVPNGFTESGNPTSITFLGNLYDEASILAFAKVFQEATDFDDKHPPLFK
ncbi:amidase [Fulvivirgaceae bacterium BMA10]|uniref:Amidase n=1 Tax=Splendidivirga corallicola TaxID=3051826 RepID=A0ABT8KTC8_9BACT|nr:amidase [Fulvivirgaceae bacterium BMA10]